MTTNNKIKAEYEFWHPRNIFIMVLILFYTIMIFTNKILKKEPFSLGKAATYFYVWSRIMCFDILGRVLGHFFLFETTFKKLLKTFLFLLKNPTKKKNTMEIDITKNK